MSGADFKLGVALPNYGPTASAWAVESVATAARDLGYASVWATEHLLVASDVPERFQRSLDSMDTLAWLAGRVSGIALGASVVVLPLHHPVDVAKRAATLQLLSGNQFRLGVGIGWHRAEFAFLNSSFGDRHHRTDEALELIHALWRGDRSFRGRYWAFEDAAFGPLPEVPPEIWIGGNARGSLLRARRLGAVWHPDGVGVDAVSRAHAEWPEGRIVPRVAVRFEEAADGLAGPPARIAEQVDALRRAGCCGLVLEFGLDHDVAVARMQRFASEVTPLVS